MRIAHITDLHLRHHLPGSAPDNTRRSRRSLELLREALQQARRHGADLVALTGDLLDVPAWLARPVPGFIHDPAAFWQQAALRDYQLLRNVLEDSGLPYMVLPGDTDDPMLMAQVFPREDEVRDMSGFRIVSFSDCLYQGRTPRRFLSPRMRWKQLLADQSSPPQIHLQHYLMQDPPGDSQPDVTRQAVGACYEEAPSMLRAITAAGPRVHLMLSGHHHPGTLLSRVEQTWFSAGTALCNWPHRWRMIEVNAGTTPIVTEHEICGSRPRRPVVFLDRDGVINDLPAFYAGPDRMRLLPQTGAAVAALNRVGWAVVVITAQSGVGNGNQPPEIVDATHDVMHRLLAEHGAWVDAIFYSMSAGPDAVLPQYTDLSEAKPNPTLLFRAAEQLHLDLRGAWMVGDRVTDVQTGLNAGVQPMLVRTGLGTTAEAKLHEGNLRAIVVDDLAQAVARIIQES